LKRLSLKIKLRLILPVIGVFLLLAGVLIGVIFHYIWKNLENDFLNRAAGVEILLKENIKTEARGFQHSLSFLKENKRLQNTWQSRNYKEVENVIDSILSSSVLRGTFSEIRFFLPDGTLVSKLAEYPKNGDDAKLMEKALTLGKTVYGMEFRHGCFHITLTEPWTFNSKLEGYIEVSAKSEYLLFNAKKAFGVDIVLAVDKKYLGEKEKDTYPHTARQHFVESTIRNIPKSIFNTDDSKTPKGREARLLDVSGSPFLISYIPLHDSSSQEIGSIYILQNVSSELDLYYHKVSIFSLFAAGCGILIIFIFLLYMRRMEGGLDGYAQEKDTTQRDYSNTEKSLGEARRALEISRERLNMALEGTDQGLWDWNILHGELYLSPKYYILFGYTPYEFDSSYNEWEKRVNPEDLPNFMEKVMTYLKGKGNFLECEYRFKAKNGQWRWSLRRGKTFEKDENGTPLRIVGTDIDITDRKKFENTLRENSSRFMALFEDSPISILEEDWSEVKKHIDYLKTNNSTAPAKNIFDNDSELKACQERIKLININKSALKMLGATNKEELIDRIGFIFQDVNIDYFRKQMGSFAAGSTDFRHEVKITTSSGKEIFADLRFLVMPGYEESAERVLISMIDITEIKNTGKALFEAKVQAEAANKAKSMFLANMSHEIRTPLNAIIGFSDITLETKVTKEQRSFLEIIKKRGEDLLSLISDILDYSKLEAGKFELSENSVNLRKLIEDVSSTFKARFEKNKITYRCSISDKIPQLVVGDELRIKQVLMNVLSNAFKFTENGCVTFEAGPAPDSMANIITQHPGKILIYFKLADTGVGIPEEKIDSIFENFTQVDTSMTRTHGGTGLGLAIAKSLVKFMDGTIWVESVLGKGSTFHFIMQLSLPENTQSERALPGGAERPEFDKHLSILVTEDDSTNQFLIEKLLTKNGHTVTIASNGLEAVEKFEGGKFDLILMDVQMPQMDGLTASVILRDLEKSRGTHVPIIALTAHVGKEDIEKCFKAGMDAYLPKPVKKAELFQAIMDSYFKGLSG